MSSILFDDLNDQEFNEALKEFYDNDSENEVTNLFEQSFEDRLDSNKLLINEDTEYFLLEEEMKRSQLPDSVFGVPEERKYPLDSEKHVRSAIKLFNYVDPKYEAALAKKIKRKMKEYNITDISVGENNRFSKYYHSEKKAVNEAGKPEGYDAKSGWMGKDKDGKWVLFSSEDEYNEYLKDQEDNKEVEESYNDFYYTRKDALLEELGEFITESKVQYLEKDSKVVKMPKVCPKCGSKMGIFIQGEPVCLCTNKDCKYYAGTVCFDQKEAAKKCNESTETLQEFNKDVEAYYKYREALEKSSGKEGHRKSEEFYHSNKELLDKFRDKGSNVLRRDENGRAVYSATNMREKENKDKLNDMLIKASNKDISERETERQNNLKFAKLLHNNESTVLTEAEEEEVKDKVKGKPSPISSEAVKLALESAAEIPDEKKRSAKIREVISSTIGKLSAKIKHVFGNLKLYDNEYIYDGYIRELFPKYLDMLNAKDLYKLKQSIMEHAFTTGRGHKSLKDVINTNQMSSDKDNYLYNLADKVRRDLSVLLHTIDAKYEKARFDGAKPYQKEEEVEEPTPVKKTKDEDDDEDDEEKETPKKEEPKKKRKSYWDVDVSEEEEEELSHESAEVLNQYKKTYTWILHTEPVENTLNSWLKDAKCKDVDELRSKMKEAWVDINPKNKDYPAEYVFRFKDIPEDSDLNKKLFVVKYNAKTKDIKVLFKDDTSTNESAEILEESDRLYTDKQCDKIMESYRKHCISELKKIKELKSVTAVDHGCAIDILFKSDNFDEIEKLARDKIVPIMKDAMNKFKEKYNSKFYWKDKVFTKDGLLIVLDSDIYYDLKESAEILIEGLFSKAKDKKLVKKHSRDIDKAYEYINSKLKSYSFYYPFPKDKLLPSGKNGTIEFIAGYIDLPKLYKSVYGPNLNKIIESQQPADKVKERLNSFDDMMDALSTDDIKAYFDYVHPESFYINNKEGNFQVDMHDFSSAPQLVVKLRTSAVKESTELLEEKAKIKSDDPDDAGYYETNIKIKGAKVVVCSRYHEEAEAQIKSMSKAFKNVEKSYSNVLESVANEIYNEWSKDHGEKLSRKDFIREIYKSKLQNRVIAYKDDYGFVFEFNYSINPMIGGRLLNISIYTDLDGFVSSYKYELESTVRRW